MKAILFILLTLSIFSVLRCARKRVILIGVDGFLQRCMPQMKQEVFNIFKEKGSWTFNARTTIQAVSAPGWSNILFGMETEASGIINNDWIPGWFYKSQNDISAISEKGKLIPTVFSELKSQKPDLKLGALYDWNWFLYAGNLVYSNVLTYENYCTGDTYENYMECDIENYNKFSKFIEKDLDFLFFYYGSLDESGHTYGFCSNEYIATWEKISYMIMHMFDILKDHNIFEEVTIILTTDHGASYMTKDHGSQTDDNLIIPWMIMGPGIKKGLELKSYVKNMDTTPTIMKVLGLQSNLLWRGLPVKEAFEENICFLN